MRGLYKLLTTIYDRRDRIVCGNLWQTTTTCHKKKILIVLITADEANIN